MNPVVIVHFLAAVVTIALSVPLIGRKVPMNRWYGVRIPAAFTSEAAWYNLNRYGGRLLLVWGLAIAATASTGAFLAREHWIAYNWTALVIIMGGLGCVVARVYWYARRQTGADTMRGPDLAR